MKDSKQRLLRMGSNFFDVFNQIIIHNIYLAGTGRGGGSGIFISFMTFKYLLIFLGISFLTQWNPELSFYFLSCYYDSVSILNWSDFYNINSKAGW